MAKGKKLVMQTHLFFDIPGNQHGVKTIELKGAFEIVNREFQLTMGNPTRQGNTDTNVVEMTCTEDRFYFQTLYINGTGIQFIIPMKTEGIVIVQTTPQVSYEYIERYVEGAMIG